MSRSMNWMKKRVNVNRRYNAHISNYKGRAKTLKPDVFRDFLIINNNQSTLHIILRANSDLLTQNFSLQ